MFKLTGSRSWLLMRVGAALILGAIAILLPPLVLLALLALIAYPVLHNDAVKKTYWSIRLAGPYEI